MKKEKLLAVVLWLIVAYAVALLVYCTLYFVCGKSDGYISAFGSILSAVAGFSACFVALYLYSSWQEQKFYDLKKGYIEKIAANIFSIDDELEVALMNLELFLSKYDTKKQFSIANFDLYDLVKLNTLLKESTNFSKFLKEIFGDDSINNTFDIYVEKIKSLLTLVARAINQFDNFNKLYKNKIGYLEVLHFNRADFPLEFQRMYDDNIAFLKKENFILVVAEYDISLKNLTSILSEKIKPV
ncbi:hypothetical protein WH285_13885 [Acinetobacter johnsonii]|uniref:hypothetical protein n=1 Tax=Acinetobacter johnsonii TaxID=40214 RepID=UPI003098CA0A